MCGIVYRFIISSAVILSTAEVAGYRLRGNEGLKKGGPERGRTLEGGIEEEIGKAADILQRNAISDGDHVKLKASLSEIAGLAPRAPKGTTKECNDVLGFVHSTFSTFPLPSESGATRESAKILLATVQHALRAKADKASQCLVSLAALQQLHSLLTSLDRRTYKVTFDKAVVLLGKFVRRYLPETQALKAMSAGEDAKAAKVKDPLRRVVRAQADLLKAITDLHQSVSGIPMKALVPPVLNFARNEALGERYFTEVLAKRLSVTKWDVADGTAFAAQHAQFADYAEAMRLVSK